MAADIQIERFEVDVTTNGQTHTLTNDVGATSKAFVRILGASDHASAGPTGSTSTAGPDDVSCGVQLTDTDELTFYVDTGGVKVMGEVWRYTGAASGDYEFITRQRGSVTVTGTSNSASLSGVSDRNSVIPFYTGYVTAEASNSNFEYASLYCYVDGSTNIVFGRNNSGTSITAYYEAVEFTGSAWSVGHAVSSAHDTNGGTGETVTMNTDSTGTGGSTFDVSDWETAAIMDGTMGGDAAETGLSDCIIYIFPPAGTTQLTFMLDNTSSRNDSSAYAHILQCDDMVVKRTSSINLTEGNGSYGTSLSMPTGTSATTDLSEMGLEWFPGTNGEGTAHARGRLHAQIIDNSGYEIQHWVHRSGNGVDAYYASIDISALEAAAGGLEPSVSDAIEVQEDSTVIQTHNVWGDITGVEIN